MGALSEALASGDFGDRDAGIALSDDLLFAVALSSQRPRGARAVPDHEPFAAPSTAGAIPASLLANTTMTTWGKAARAPWISSLRRYRLPRLLMPRSFGLPPVVN